jgi:hypothetical protein
MNTDFRNRAFLPIVLPILILLGMAAFIGVFALTLLYSTHEASLLLAALAAGGILFTISLAASQDRLDPVRRGVLAIAVAVPFLIGGLYAAGVIGDIPEDARMINVEPPLEAPEDAVLAAQNDQDFCLPTNGDCEDTDFWSVATQGPEQFVYRFENIDQGVPHNLSIRELEGDRDDPQPGDVLHEGNVINGVEEVTEVAVPGLEPGDYYFVCDVHAATMTGVLEVTDGGGGDDGEEGDGEDAEAEEADDAGDEDTDEAGEAEEAEEADA